MNALTPSSSNPPPNPADAILLRYFARICEELDLPGSQFQLAKKRYEAIGRLLCEPPNPLARFKPTIYPQGSTRLQTTVKPPKGDEFDIDLICELEVSAGRTPDAVYSDVKAAILVDRTYSKMLSEKNRCVRITYANEFHLDITPAQPDRAAGPENIRITDRPSSTWKASNPKDFGDWFTGIAETPPNIRSTVAKTAAFEDLLETRAGVEPVATPKVMRPVLNRIVQVFKRHRDIMYDANPKDAPISAIITTTAAHAYASLVTVEFGSLYDLILEVARAMKTKLGPAAIINGRPIYTVPNPANALENFADKWPVKPNRQDEFFRWQEALTNYLSGLRLVGGKGFDELNRKLSGGFGADLIRRLTVEQAQTMRKGVERGQVEILSTGLLGAQGASHIAVRPQTFHN